MSAGLAGVREQLAGNPRLRIGLWAVGALLWTYALLLGSDAVESMRRGNAELRGEVERLRPLARERDWPERVEQARREREALQAMLWSGRDVGLVEAALQDRIRAAASKWGVDIRVLELVRGAGARGPADSVELKLRLGTDFKRVPMLGFLSELADGGRVVLVDRLALRLAAQPPIAELELRAYASVPAASGAAR